ncbi:uncharacterized protein MONBRDRAFT_891, partial [Monosiga brevicollis MX1]
HHLQIMADDLGYYDLGYRNPDSITPNIDQLATQEGVILDNAYGYRYCSPSRASFLTGRVPIHVHQGNPGLAAAGCTNLNYTMIPAQLRRAGYRTAMVGKWHQGASLPECLPVNRGFDTSFGYLSGEEDHMDQTTNGGQCNVTDFWLDSGPAIRRNGTYSSFQYNDAIVDIIQQHAPEQPLMLYAALQNVHGPYEVPERYRAKFPADKNCTETGDNPTSQCTRDFMLAMVNVLDDIVGNITRALKANGMWNNTVLVFSSDNGGAVPGAPQHGSMNNHPLRGGKVAYFEGGVRTAAFVASPLLPKSIRGTELRGLIHISDWYATFCHLAG